MKIEFIFEFLPEPNPETHAQREFGQGMAVQWSRESNLYLLIDIFRSNIHHPYDDESFTVFQADVRLHLE